MTALAFLGTGIMGAPMARNLATAGFEVTVWNRTRAKAEPLADDGIAVADSAAEAARGADLLVTMLPSGDIVEAAVRDALGELADGAVWIQMSTVGPAATDTLARLAADAGVTFVDAPVSGTKQPAEDGALVVLGSGPDDARSTVAPVFDAVGGKTVWAGGAGKGSALKLVVNTWLLSVVEGLAETVGFAEGLGVDPHQFLETIEGGPLDADYAQLKGKAMVAGEFEPSFTLTMAHKDAKLVRDCVEANGLDLPLAELFAERMARAEAAGHGDEDLSAVVAVSRGGSGGR